MNNKRCNFGWPFYRYCVLVPEKVDFDLLEWLFISLVIYQNQNDNINITNINEDTLIKVNNLFKIYFSNLIDDQLFEKLKYQILEKYVVRNNNTKVLDKEVIIKLNSYSNLFSDSLSIKYFYQDGLTGTIFPHFYTENELSEIEAKECIEPKNIIKALKQDLPQKRHIQKAYEEFLNLSSITQDKSEQIEDNKNKSKEIEENNKFTVIFLPEKTELIYYEIYLEQKNDDLICKSPFGIVSDKLMLDCLIKSKQLSEQVNTNLQFINNTYLTDKKIEIDFSAKYDYASSLKYFSTLYRLIENIDDNRIKEQVSRLDKLYIEKDEDFYGNCGKYLERLKRKVKYNESNKLERENISDSYILQKELNKKFEFYNDKFTVSKNVFSDWKKKYRSPNHVYESFQADFMDILLKSNINKASNFYDGFINDTLNIYKMRSGKSSHAHDEKVVISSDVIEKLINITKVFLDVM